MAAGIFSSFSQQFDPALNAGVSQVVSSSLQLVAPELASLLTLYVLIQGMMIMFGQYDAWKGTVAIMRAAIVSLLLTAAFFAQYIQTPIIQTIPNLIAHAGGMAPVNGIGQFDALGSAIEHFGAGIIQQASGLSGIAQRAEVAILIMVCISFIAIGAVIWEITTGFLNLVVCIGPFAILAYLFTPTRGVAERWIGAIIGMLMLYLLITILTQISFTAETFFIRQVQANPGAGIDEQIAAMADMAVFFFMCATMLIFVPGLAAFVGGGVHSNAVAVALIPLRVGARKLT